MAPCLFCIVSAYVFSVLFFDNEYNFFVCCFFFKIVVQLMAIESIGAPTSRVGSLDIWQPRGLQKHKQQLQHEPIIWQ